MRTLVCFFVFLSACSSSKGTFRSNEEHHAKFGNTRSLTEAPDVVKRAAKALIEDLHMEGNPVTPRTVEVYDTTISSGWVYGKSKDKFVEFSYNGVPRRKELSVRRRYSFTIVSGLSGTDVTVGAEEEIEHVDLNTGEPKGWENEDPDSSVFDMMVRRLREKIRSL